MLAVQSSVMLHASGPPSEPTRPYYHHERNPSSSTTLHSPTHYGLPLPPASRASTDLPRPVEPATSHHAHNLGPLPRENYSQPPSTTLPGEPRHVGPSLPGVRDILSGSSKPPAPASYNNGAWSQPAGPVSHHPHPTPHHPGPPGSFSGWHPPMALYPPPEPHGQHYPLADRRPDLPYAEPSAPSRPIQRTSPTSPYATYPDQQRHEYAEGRRQGSITSHGAASSYGSSAADDQYYTSPSTVTLLDRQPPSSIPINGSDAQRKYIGVRDVPGEGQFHLYEGGYRIPTHVDGEQVNPAWGLTKANKPRKRLALACLDCREKKIKCEPGLGSSCLQCEKAKRRCRKAPAQPPQSDAVPPPPISWSHHAGSAPPAAYGIGPSSEPDAELLYKRRAREEPSPTRGSKKQRSTSPTTRPYDSTAAHCHQHTYDRGTLPKSPRRALALTEDPLVIDPEATRHCLHMYLTYVNCTIHSIFPRKAIMHWLTTQPEKREVERMVLYAMLAAGSVFGDERLGDFGRTCAEIASAAAITGRSEHITVFHVVTKLILAIFFYATEDSTRAYDMMASGIRLSLAPQVRLNTESTDSEDVAARRESRVELGLTREQLTELKRRVFWSAFLMDRLTSGTLQMIDLQDVFIRLPCDDRDYESSRKSGAPVLNNGIVHSESNNLTASAPVSPTARLVAVCSILGEVLTFISRAPHRHASIYREAYEAFYAKTQKDLNAWMDGLPQYLRYSASSLERAIYDGYGDVFIALHCVYHFILMKLNRCVRHKLVLDVIARNIRSAHYHAHSVLAIMLDLRSASRETVGLDGERQEYVFSSPLCGVIIETAVDVVGAGGLDSTLQATRGGISAGIETLRELAHYWVSVREPLSRIQNRAYQIENMVRQPVRAKGGCWIGREWGMYEPIGSDFEPADDCIWGMSEDQGKPNAFYFDALKDSELQHAIGEQLYRGKSGIY